MKKILAFILALLLVLSMAVPAAAITPPLQVPDMPEIKVEIELPDSAFEDYIPEISIEVTEPTEPTKPPDQEEVCILRGWYQWWKDFLARLWP